MAVGPDARVGANPASRFHTASLGAASSYRTAVAHAATIAVKAGSTT